MVSFPRLAQLLGFRAPSGTGAKARYRPRLEALENRLVPSAGERPFFTHEPETPAEDATDPLSVVTYNVDPGSHLAPLLAAPSPQALPGAMSQVWAEVLASDIPGRARVIARDIARSSPDVIGLQGAAVWSVNGAAVFDFLRLIQRDLRAFGQPYAVASRAAVNVVQLPDAAGNQIDELDQTAVLVSAGMGERDFARVRPRQGVFTAASGVQIGGPQGPVLSVLGTWASVDFINSENGFHNFRFVSAHLDGLDPAVNGAQAAELLAGPGHTGRPVIFVGDFGFAPAVSPAYQEINQSNFIDAWMPHHAADPGFTSAEPNLLDPGRELQARTDVVFYSAEVDFNEVTASLLGFRPTDRTPSGLLPSDHAGVHDLLLLP
jgi:hypothetical protein